ncbi:MAG: iron chaperone [Candidatus Aminicenantes bacterium RBG_16_66_30]
MKSRNDSIRSVDDYIAGLPERTKGLMVELRRSIRAAAPGAEEKISYQMPAFYLEGTLVYFAAFKNHIGFYPTSSGVAAFSRELAPYGVSKGTVRFPLDQPLPLRLITRIVKFRVAENLKKADRRIAKSR